MKGGYIGKILRVDLTSGVITRENLPAEDILRKYVGGTGLAVKILNDELSVKTKPFSPDNLLIFMTGPLTGTPFPSSSDTSVVTLNANTGYTVGDGHTHGFFGAYLKFAGYDGIIVQGAAKKPVYLWIYDGEVEIRDATAIWGKDTHETEDLVKAEIGAHKVSVAAIGPAGENLIHGSGIFNDKYHSACKAGIGAVMGSKNLKAIAVKGTGEVPVVDPAGLLKVVKEWHDIAFPPGVSPESVEPHYHATGQINIWPVFAKNNWMVYKNLLNCPGEEAIQELQNGKRNFKVRATACWSCSIACSYRSEATFGPHKGYVATLAGGGENQEGAAFVVGITEPSSVEYLTDLNDRLGMDSADPGSCLGLAFEMYERGLLTREQTDGLELKWGNAEAAEALVRKIVKREGFGKIFAEGAKKAAEILGGDALKYAIHIKGGGYNYHDWRTAWGIMLGQATAGAGACWQGSFAGDHRCDPDLGYAQRNTPFTTEGLAEVTARSSTRRVWEDCYGQCFFADLMAYPGGSVIPIKGIAAIVGWQDFTFDEAMTIGHRTITLERIFNMKRGLTIESDMDVSPRLLEAPREGRGMGKTVAPYLRELIMEFYKHMGWDKETGKPTQQTLEKLDLVEAAKGL